MKKRLLAIVLVLMLALTLLPTAAFAAGEGSADLGTTKTHCYKCGTITTFKILAYIRTPIASKPDPYCHWARAECTKCGGIMEFVPDGDSAYHIGGTETPTCTTGKTCEKCGDEYGILGHEWGVWTNPTEGTHRRVCQRAGCNAVEEGRCDGTATCQALAKCTVCGAEHGEKGGHSFSLSWRSDTEQHWHYCLTPGCDAKSDVGYHNIDDNHYCPTCHTSPIPCMDTDNDHKCDGCGKTISDHTGGTANCHTKAVCEVCNEAYGTVDATKHDGGTEIKDVKAAACTEKGYTGDTYCKGCGEKMYDGTDIPAAGHKLKHVPAKRATSFVAGNIEYWYCTVCGKYFRDAAATQEITKEATVTYKESAPTQDNKTVRSSKTGDPGVMLYAGMAVLSLTGCAWLRRKEK